MIYPKRIHVELTTSCNYRCIMCPHGYSTYGASISDKLFDVLCNELIPSAKVIEMQGTGEALTYHKFFDLLNVMVAHNCKPVLITNASLLNEEALLALCKAGSDIVVSIDAAESSLYSQIRRGGDLSKVLANLGEWKYIKHSFQNQSSLGINMVLCSLNAFKIIEMIDLAERLDVDYLFISEIRKCVLDDENWRRLNIVELRAKPDFQRYLSEATKYAKKKALRIQFNFKNAILASEVKRNICVSPWEHIYISVDGSVSLCCELSQQFGNLNESSFSEIWNSDSLNDFRKKMATGQYCNTCLGCCLPWGITH